MTDFHLHRLGQSLKARRLGRGLTQAAVAALAGVTRLRVIQVEQGQGQVAIQAYAAVAHALGAEVSLTLTHRPTLEEARAFFAEAD
jgi:transcriptional regulator with XRE-family HTH domain